MRKEDTYLFTSESVSEGHPDKVADQISDAILDAFLTEDPKSRVACEIMVSAKTLVVGGEITSQAKVDIPEVVRHTIKSIGYDDIQKGLDYKTCPLLLNINAQSQDIANGIKEEKTKERSLKAGDQGLMLVMPQRSPEIICLSHLLWLINWCVNWQSFEKKKKFPFYGQTARVKSQWNTRDAK